VAVFFAKGAAVCEFAITTIRAVAVLLIVQDAVVYLLTLWCRKLRGGW
jgi:hypothetical protein